MPKGNNFPLNIRELSVLLEQDANFLKHICRKTNIYYRRGEKIKPDGRIREFFKPQKELKKIQKAIHRKILRKLPIHFSIHSYRKKRDQISNAEPHVGNPYMINLDIKDFFPSISPSKVYTTFKKLGFSDPISRMLVALTTYQNQLPQGPPTSPGIANLVLFPLVRRFENVCVKHGVKLSVFGDDITASGSSRILKLKNLFYRIILESDYKIHPGKIKVSKPGSKKIVTGVVVNEKINVDKLYFRTLRAQIHNILIKGAAVPSEKERQKIRNSLFGKINYVKRLNATKGYNLMQEFNRIDWSR